MSTERKMKFAPASLRAENSAKATRSSPSRKAKEDVNYCRFGREGKRYIGADQKLQDDDDPFTDLSGFIVDDDADLSIETNGQESEEETVQPSRRWRKDAMNLSHRRQRKRSPQMKDRLEKAVTLDSETISLTSALKTLDLSTVPKLDLKPAVSSVMLSPVKNVRISPFDERPTHRERDVSTPEPSVAFPGHDERSGFVTPPTSPSKARLKSPSKSSRQIPQPPHRQSLDSFWSSDAINTWNDRYSPMKTPHTNRKGIRKFVDFSDNDLDSGDRSRSPSPSPTRNPRPLTTSPSKPKSSPSKLCKRADRAALEKRKTFGQVKHRIANELLSELDEKICDNKLSIATVHSGGVKIIWSKTLTKTAGRANWRRTNAYPNVSDMMTFATIELAEKIVDSPERLVNTLAHELCHLANYEVSKELADPHGKSWRNWVNKTLQYLRSHENPMYRNVEITAKHNYQIDYRYVWLCVGTEGVDLLTFSSEGCGMEYGRHSKSINPERERCSRCKGLLVQVKPAPRTRKALLDRALRTSPSKKKTSVLSEMMLEDLREVNVRQNTVAEEEKAAQEIEILDLDDKSRKVSETAIIVDLTESSDVDENTVDLFPVITGQDGLEKKVLGPSAGNLIKSPVLAKVEPVLDFVDLTDE